MTTWLVTGGAGYIGSHVARSLLTHGHQVVVLDDFSTGLTRRVPDGVPVAAASVHDTVEVSAALRDHRVDGVIHLAAKKAPGESVELPELYYRENVGGLASVLEAMRATDVTSFVFSSSASVYGTPTVTPVEEDAPLHPESPYGETKVVGEWMARDAGVAWGLSWSALRYFNVAGAGADDLGDNSVANLIPMVFRALGRGERPQVFGADYPTPDGTCVRDYIHVVDLADAHVAAAAALLGRRAGRRVQRRSRRGNQRVRGDGRDQRGSSGVTSTPRSSAGAAGDPAATFASTAKIADLLGWRASRDLRDMVESAWSAWQAHPGG